MPSMWEGVPALLVALAYAQTSGNITGNATGRAQWVIETLFAPFVTAFEVIWGILFWILVIIAILYITARRCQGHPDWSLFCWFAESVESWLTSHVKIIVILVLIFIAPFIMMWAIMSAAGVSSPGAKTLEIFLKIIFFNRV